MAIVADQVRVRCSDGYNVAINGIGVGLRFSMASGFIVSCIGNSDDLKGNYYGAKADAALLLGVSGAAFVGKKGVCAIGGVSIYSFGVGASISSLQIY